MPRSGRAQEPLADLASRRDELRQAAGAPGADAAALLDAALAELDGAVDALAGQPDDGPDGGAGQAGLDAQRAERRLLQATFQQAPVPVLVLERDGTIRRANARAAQFLGFPVGYATGRPLPAFLDAASRAAARSHLAAVARTGQPWQAECRVLTAAGTADAVLAAAAVSLPGEQALIVVALTPAGQPASPSGDDGPSGRRGAPPGRGPSGHAAPAVAAEAGSAAEVGAAEVGTAEAGRAADAAAGQDDAIRAVTRRLDLVTAAARLLLDNSAFSEAVTARRLARLLAGPDALAAWVILDAEHDGRLRRQVVAGPREQDGAGLAGAVREAGPPPDSLPGRVHATGRPALIAHADDAGLLGDAPDGTPLLTLLGVTSLACVPVREPGARYGTLTLARAPGAGPFGLADLALAEELGAQLALAIGVSRRFRERSQAALTLQASLLPARLPEPPGLELAAEYLAATGWQEIGADFYDAFPIPGGWAVAVGDVSGRGQDAAAMTAAARHSIRALTVTRPAAPAAGPSPSEVLAAVNGVLLAGGYDDRFVTVRLAFLCRAGALVRVRLGGAGHPGPAVLRADGRVEVLGAAGRPLGLFADARPDERELELADGDLLLFYTDGAAGARGTDLASFEEGLADRLAALAGRPAAEVVRAAQDVAAGLTGGELRDDVTLLAVRAVPVRAVPVRGVPAPAGPGPAD